MKHVVSFHLFNSSFVHLFSLFLCNLSQSYIFSDTRINILIVYPFLSSSFLPFYHLLHHHIAHTRTVLSVQILLPQYFISSHYVIKLNLSQFLFKFSFPFNSTLTEIICEYYITLSSILKKDK
jgi:hypothetical protein